jgi:uncharacterized protein
MLNGFQVSRYTTEIDAKARGKLLYNSFTNAFSLLEPADLELYERVKAGRGGELDKAGHTLLDELLIHNYVVPKDFDELEAVRRKYTELRDNASGMTLTVVPTLNCIFACDYCFQGAEKSPAAMEKLDIEKVVALVRKNSENLKTLNVTWFGGEPLMSFKSIKRISDRLIPFCDIHGIGYSAMVVTNGYLMTPEIVGELYVRRVRTVQITLDGGQKEHDQLRYLKDTGAGSFERIVKNVQAYSAEVPISTTFRINIDQRNKEAIYGLLDRLGDAGFQKGRVSVYFAPIESSTNACRGVANSTLGRREFARLEVELLRRACVLGLSSPVLPYQMVGLCGATKARGYVVLPGGDIHKCWETASFPDRKTGIIGEDGAYQRNTLTARWEEWTPFSNEDCRKCSALPNCVGFCSYKFLYKEEFNDASGAPCPSLKYNMRERLLQMAEAKQWIDTETASAVMSELRAEASV